MCNQPEDQTEEELWKHGAIRQKHQQTETETSFCCCTLICIQTIFGLSFNFEETGVENRQAILRLLS